VIAQINHAIGAVGLVSQDCKAVVAQYGKTILDKLINKVILLIYISRDLQMLHSCISNQTSLTNFQIIYFIGFVTTDLLSNWFVCF